MTRAFKYVFFILIFIAGAMNAQTIAYTLLIKNADCHGENNGRIKVNITSLNPPYSYLWSNGQTGSEINELQPGNYSVLITDGSLNDSVVSVTITERKCDIGPAISFTPNGDDYNDVWFIQNIQFYPDNKILVYNRWGQKVFESKGTYTSWDGKDFFGSPVPDGTYFYIIDGGLEEETIVIKGTVSILR